MFPSNCAVNYDKISEIICPEIYTHNSYMPTSCYLQWHVNSQLMQYHASIIWLLINLLRVQRTRIMKAMPCCQLKDEFLSWVVKVHAGSHAGSHLLISLLLRSITSNQFSRVILFFNKFNKLSNNAIKTEGPFPMPLITADFLCGCLILTQVSVSFDELLFSSRFLKHFSFHLGQLRSSQWVHI